MKSDGGRRAGRRATLAALALVIVVAAAPRAGYLKGFQESPFSQTPLAGEVANVSWAKVIAEIGSLGDEPLTRPPLYPLLLSIVNRSGEDWWVARLVQAATGVLVACLVFFTGRLLVGGAGGLLAGLICGLYGPALYWEAQLVPTSIVLLVFTCFWLAAVGAWRRGSAPLWVLPGVLLGCMGGLSFGALTLALPAVLLAASRREGGKHVRIWVALAALAVGTALPLVPFVLHNARTGAGDIGVAGGGGVKFYVANNPSATGLPPSMAGEDTWWHGDKYAAAEVAARSGAQPDAGQVSRYWFTQGLRFIVREPGAYLKLLGRKLAHFWTRHELTEGPSPSFVAGSWIPWSAFLMHAFAVLGALGLAGAVTARRHPEALALLYPMIGALAFGLVYTSAASTRLLAVPSVALLSAVFLLNLWSLIRRRLWKGTLGALAALAGAAAFVNLLAPWASGVVQPVARDHRLLGAVYEIQGRGTLALDQYDKAVRMAPRDQSCRLSLAAMMASDGVASEAERHFLAAAALDTLSPAPYLGLANLYRRNGLMEQALHSLERALERAPYDIGLAISLGRSCIQMGLYEQAEAYFRRALAVDPENIQAIDGLLELRDRGVYVEVQERGQAGRETVKGRIQVAMERLREGDFETSKKILDELVAEEPEDLDVTFAIATWHLTAGESQEAIAGYERCLESNPNNPIVLNNLASAYHDTGKVERAIELWQRVLALDPNNVKARANLERAQAERAQGTED